MIMDDPDPYTHKQTVDKKMFKLSDVQMITLRQLYVDKDFACSEIVDGVFTIHMKKLIHILKIAGQEAYFKSKHDAMMCLDKYKQAMKSRGYITILIDEPDKFAFSFSSDDITVSVFIRSPKLNNIPSSWLWYESPKITQEL